MMKQTDTLPTTTKEQLALTAAKAIVADFTTCNQVPTATGHQEHDMPFSAAMRCAEYHVAGLIRDTVTCPAINLHWIEVQKALKHV